MRPVVAVPRADVLARAACEHRRASAVHRGTIGGASTDVARGHQAVARSLVQARSSRSATLRRGQEPAATRLAGDDATGARRLVTNRMIRLDVARLGTKPARPTAVGRAGRSAWTSRTGPRRRLSVVDRRIFGIENEYGVTCTFKGQRRLSPDEVARYLFRKVVSWGRSSNVFLRNGARLYLDVGSHPEYATPECDDVVELVTHDKAGERVLEGLLLDAEQRLHDEGIAGEIYLFKNNTDSAGNSYGCHENYLVSRAGEFSRLADVLIPFLVTRQIIVGAGKVTQTAARRVVRRVASAPSTSGRASRSATTRSPADHQHPRRAARRRREVPPPARHRRRLQHERDHHDAQGGQLRPGAADDRGGRGDARPHDGEPDPRDPRDLATTSPAGARSAWPTAARRARSTSSTSTSPRPATSSTAARSARRSSSGRSTCGSAASRRSSPTTSAWSTARSTGSSSGS